MTSHRAGQTREHRRRHSPWADLFHLGSEQQGAFAVRQAVGLGIPRRTVEQRASREGYLRPYPGVVLLPGWRLSPAVEPFAAALSVGPEAVVTGRSGLRFHGLPSAGPARSHLVVPAGRQPRAPGRTRLVRSRTLCDADWELVGQVRVATPTRAVLDLAAVVGVDTLRSVLLDGRQRRILDPAAVAARLQGLPTVPGRGRLVAACADVAGSGADSPLAARVERWLRTNGYRLDVPARTVRAGDRLLHPDITLSGLSIAIEVDGLAYHADRRALDLDQRKHNAYLLAGWIVLRIGWDRFEHDRRGFLQELGQAVAQTGGE